MSNYLIGRYVYNMNNVHCTFKRNSVKGGIKSYDENNNNLI